jgi:D-alanine-D-alanine ligase
MKVGITYDLRTDYLLMGYGEEETAEFDKQDTIDAIEGALNHLGYETDRIGHIRALVKRLSEGDRWDMVFNIAEGLHGFGREALVPSLLESYGIPCTFSDPMVLSLTLHKAMTKRVVRDLGIATPDFWVVEKESDVRLIDPSFPLFAKPVAEGTGKGITAASKIMNRNQLAEACCEMLAHYRQPVLVESFLPGREFTVGILGTGDRATPIGVMEILLNDRAEPDVYSYTNKENYENRVHYRLIRGHAAQKVSEVALKAYQGLGCRDAGRVDLRMDAHDRPNFIEINPLAGLNPTHSDLCIIARKAGMDFEKLIAGIMTSAVERCHSTMKEDNTHEDWYYFQPAGRTWPKELGSLG